MKKLVYTTIAVLAGLSGIAQWQGNGGNYGRYGNASLIVSMQTQRNFTVTIDNQSSYNSQGNGGYQNTAYISQLSAGNHQVVVYEYRRNIFGQQRQEVVYNNSLYLRDGFETTISINSFGQATTSERQVNYGNNNGGYGNNGNGVGWGYGRKKHKRKCGNDRDFDRNRRDRDDRQDDWNRNRNLFPMNGGEFEQLKQSMRNTPFDDTRMTIAKQALQSNYLSTYQVKDLLNLFSFESSKLDLAKYAYRFTTDRNIYYTVADAFTFSSSKEELMRHINNG